jgi:hypothetical protein
VSAIAIRRQKVRDFAAAGQFADWHVPPVRNSKRLDARAVDPIKVPYERQHFGEFANSVSLAALEHPRNSPPGAVQF